MGTHPWSPPSEGRERDTKERLQELLESKDTDGALWGESWASVDGTLIISFEDSEPAWLTILKSMRDENGDTDAAVRPVPDLNDAVTC